MPAVSDFIFRDIVVGGYSVPGGGMGVLCASFAAVALPAFFFGLRSLSGDYLIRVTGMVHSGSAAKTRPHHSVVGAWAARFSGGQAGRAGFEFVANLIWRDWRFKQSMAPMAPMLIIGSIALLVLGRAVSPFSSDLAPAHLLPHLSGLAVASVCNVLAFGVDYKGVWIFQIAPDGSFSGFARGVHAALLAVFVLIPHLIWLPIAIWSWGATDAATFIAYSLAVSALYVGLTLRLICGIPFGRQFEQSRLLLTMPLMIVGSFVTLIAVVLQYILFRSGVAVVAATLLVGGAAYYMTRWSLTAVEASIRYNLKLDSLGVLPFYQEINNQAAP